MGDTALEDTAPCRFPTPKFRSPDGGKRGHGNAVFLPQNVDRPMEAKEDTATFPYAKIIDRPIEHIITTRFVGKRHCRVRISSPYPKIIDRPIEHITTTRFVGKRHCRVRISWRTIAYNHRPIRRETALPCPNFCRVLISGNG